MANNEDVAFTNVPGKTNFKRKNEDELISSIEPGTNLGFISLNRDADISDLFYVRDAMENEKNDEEKMRAHERMEIEKFRVSSTYRPAVSSTQRVGLINMKKPDKSESSSMSTMAVKLTKRRKVSDHEQSVFKDDKKIDTAGALAIPHSEIQALSSIKTIVDNVNSLSNLMGAYDDDSD